jgi:hypothetical protein
MPEADNGSWTQYQKLVLKLLEQHDEKLETLRKQLADSASDKAVISENITSMKEDIDCLLGLIRDGSMGSIPIITRVASIEADLYTLKQENLAKAKETIGLIAYKRALFVSIMGIIAAVGWDIIRMIFMAGK